MLGSHPKHESFSFANNRSFTMFPNVLLVDDAKAIHSLVHALFENEPLKLHSAYEGLTALKMIARLKPDLVLLDVDMPGINGFELCRHIRENPFTMHVPVIFLTAAAQTDQKVNGLELGAQDYIVKPFEPAELTARVHAALRIKARLDFLGKNRVNHFMRGVQPNPTMRAIGEPI